ncbi:MAG: PASTA domain-containing protein [Deltaproteobacteria bacterium]|nr:PASTA domain-containing protein [Deltaproteobacteria bacterium]
MTDTDDSQQTEPKQTTKANSEVPDGGGGLFAIINPRSVKFGLVFLAVLIVGLMIGLVVGGDDDVVADLEAQVESLSTELSSAEANLSEANREIVSFRGDAENLTEQVAVLQASVPLPDYLGDSASSARSNAEEHGWTVSEQSEPSLNPAGTVLSQEPAAGTEMELGSSVVLVVAEPMPTQWYEVWTKSGSGRVVTPVIDLPDVESGDLRVAYEFQGTGHNALWLCNMVGGKEDLLHNEIGSMSNTSTLYISWDGCVFDINGSGPWTVTLEAFGVPSS